MKKKLRPENRKAMEKASRELAALTGDPIGKIQADMLRLWLSGKVK